MKCARRAVLALLVLTQCKGAPDLDGSPSATSTTAPPNASIDPATTSASATVSAAPPEPPREWRSCLLEQPSPCVSDVPVRVSEDWIAWSDWIGAFAKEQAKRYPAGVTECRWVAELEPVLVCASSSAAAQNVPLTRAAIFTESSPRNVVLRSGRLYEYLLANVGGFDFPKTHPDPTRPGLLDFYTAIDEACATSKPKCLNEEEQAMRNLIERAWVDKPGFVIITFSRGRTLQDDVALTHEMRHAEWFTNAHYRRAIANYWEGLSDSEQQEIRRALGPIYDAKDVDLQQNEFQAYALEPHHLLSGWRPGFGLGRALALRWQLAQAGVKLIDVQRR